MVEKKVLGKALREESFVEKPMQIKTQANGNE